MVRGLLGKAKSEFEHHAAVQSACSVAQRFTHTLTHTGTQARAHTHTCTHKRTHFLYLSSLAQVDISKAESVRVEDKQNIDRLVLERYGNWSAANKVIRRVLKKEYYKWVRFRRHSCADQAAGCCCYPLLLKE